VQVKAWSRSCRLAANCDVFFRLLLFDMVLTWKVSPSPRSRAPSIAPQQLTERRPRNHPACIQPPLLPPLTYLFSPVRAVRRRSCWRLKQNSSTSMAISPGPLSDGLYHQGGSREIVEGLRNKSASALKRNWARCSVNHLDEEKGSVKRTSFKIHSSYQTSWFHCACLYVNAKSDLLIETDLATTPSTFSLEMIVDARSGAVQTAGILRWSSRADGNFPWPLGCYRRRSRYVAGPFDKSLPDSFTAQLLAYEANLGPGIN